MGVVVGAMLSRPGQDKGYILNVPGPRKHATLEPRRLNALGFRGQIGDDLGERFMSERESDLFTTVAGFLMSAEAAKRG